MSCKQCGKQHVSGLCKFCAREKSREGDWQDRLEGVGDDVDGDDDE